MDYAEFAAELARLYEEGDEKSVVLLAGEFPEHYDQWCLDYGLDDES